MLSPGASVASAVVENIWEPMMPIARRMIPR